MQANVSIPTNELKRLTLKAINGNTFTKRVISELVFKLIDRIERDYPELLKSVYTTSHRKYQEHLSLGLKRQREQNLRTLNDAYGGNNVR